MPRCPLELRARPVLVWAWVASWQARKPWYWLTLRLSAPRQRRVTAGALALFALLVCVRMPQIILKGRFWAEEGQVFFANAWNMPPGQALLNSYGGYLNLIANAATLAARWVLPLRLAPYMTITVSVLVQLCAPLLLMLARDRWLQPVAVRLAGVLLLLLVPSTGEIWLQTLHCQFQLLLCCGIILGLDVAKGRGAWLRTGVLVLAPLCGPVVIALVPLFVARAVIDGSRARLLQGVALAGGAAIQLGVFFHPQAIPDRGYTLDPATLLNVFAVRHVVMPFLGPGAALELGRALRMQMLAGKVPLIAVVLPAVVFGPAVAAMLWPGRPRAALWLMAAGLVAACASYFGARGGAATLISVYAGERYTFAPQALFALSVLALAATSCRLVSLAAWAAVAWLLTVGVPGYFHPVPNTQDGPSWRAEVAIWKADPAYRLFLWPPNWRAQLNPQK